MNGRYIHVDRGHLFLFSVCIFTNSNHCDKIILASSGLYIHPFFLLSGWKNLAAAGLIFMNFDTGKRFENLFKV
jgi:hypothetical protein